MCAHTTDLAFLSKFLTLRVRLSLSAFDSTGTTELYAAGIASLEKLMHDFSLHHRSASVPSGFIPQAGDLVSAKFSDGSWYRAKIRRSSPIKKEAEVTFIDYGNQDTVSFANIRPLDPRFRSLPGQAHDARLRYVCLF